MLLAAGNLFLMKVEILHEIQLATPLAILSISMANIIIKTHEKNQVW